jgi:hypothetical protein
MSMAKRPTQTDAQATEKIVVATLRPRCYDFCVRPKSIQFSVEGAITFKMVEALVVALGTDRINFNLGRAGDMCPPDVTLYCMGEDGYIEVLWPIPAVMKETTK